MFSVHANGADIPAIGLGTWQLRGEQAIRSVDSALAAGYRHVDTAAMYGNEAEVGEAIANSAVSRDAIFVTTKVWYSDLSERRLQRSAEASLKRLRMSEVDLLLIHWPSAEIPLQEQVRALCNARKQGLARHVGVSNFPPRYLEAAVRYADEPIVTNQVEYHPYLDQSTVVDICRREGIALSSYAPIGRGAMLDDPAIRDIAREKGRTPAQIVLRWHVQQPGTIAIPKSANPDRIRENLDVFSFELTPAEMERISALRRSGGRMVSSPTGLGWDADPA